jgi:hypothetical protein
MVFQSTGTALIRQNIADTPEINAPLIELAERYDSLKSEDTEASLLGTINAQLKQIRKMAAFAGMYSKFDSQGVVYWAEKRDDRFLLQACRLNLGETLADLMPELRLYTSATIGYWPFADFPSRKSDLIQRGFLTAFWATRCRSLKKAASTAISFFLRLTTASTRRSMHPNTC